MSNFTKLKNAPIMIMVFFSILVLFLFISSVQAETISISLMSNQSIEFTNSSGSSLNVTSTGHYDYVIYDMQTGAPTYDNDRYSSLTVNSGKRVIITNPNTYDMSGNRKTRIAVGHGVSSSIDYSYNSQNRLTGTTEICNGVSTDTTYVYDDNGNQTSIIKGSSVSSYTYDNFNQLRTAMPYDEIENSTSAAVEFTIKYDAFGQRTEKTTNGITTTYYYDGQNVILETGSNGSEARNVYGINLISRIDGSGALYYLFNGHADVIKLVNTNGSLINEYDHDIFGNVLTVTEGKPNPYGYAGYYFDTETGTYYLRARYYDPAVGRFTQEDPAGAGLNWYTYCGNDPINFFDPFGLERLVVSGGYYSSTSDYPYVFIDSSLKEILSYTGDEKSTLFIANVGLKQNDIDIIASFADFYGFGVKYFTDTSELNEYINNGDGFNRVDDPITKFRVFSHGYAGSIEFGHGVGLSATDKEKLSWTINKINQLDPNNKINYLDPNAFKKTDSIFYSCNTGTTTNGTSFAQVWSNITGGKTKAVVPRIGQTNAQTTYTGINSPVWWRFDSYLTHKFLRNTVGGYSVPYPSFSLPTPANNAKWKTFKPQ